MSTSSDLENLVSRLRDLFAAEFRRGEQAAVARLMAAAKGTARASSYDATEPGRSKKRRAPAGAPRQFMDRVLTESGSSGISAKDIQLAAVGDTEAMVSYSAIRAELQKGRGEGRYISKDGRWFLTD